VLSQEFLNLVLTLFFPMKKSDAEQIGTLLWLYHQSYLGEINARLGNLNALVDMINKLRRKRGTDGKMDKGKIHYTEEYLYLEYLSDALEKLGFLYFARDRIKKKAKDLHACKYHIYNSIFNCKSFLDTVAGLINHHYKLGKRRGNIDLKRAGFMQDLANKDPQLGSKIGKFKVWIKAISNWRDTLIHRHGILLFFTQASRISYLWYQRDLLKLQSTIYPS
jgi:hypothetical protein